MKNYSTAESFSALVNTCTSKTYTAATVRRALLRILLNVEDCILKELETLSWIPYIRVLGCKKESQVLLKQLHLHAQRPVITNLSKSYPQLDALSKQLIAYELNATKLYHYATKQPAYYTQDFTQGFLMI